MKKNLKLLSLLLLSILVLAVGVSASIDPSSFEDTYITNFTDGGGDPTLMSHERGYIHVVNIDKSQQTPRWKAYVGNVTGELALGDGNGFSIFNWDLEIVAGEIYATRYNGNITDNGQLAQGEEPHRLPRWSTMICANSTEINTETTRLNHDYNLNVDALNRTFLQMGTFSNFYVGERLVNTTNCYGTYLNYNGQNNNTDSDWQQVALTDTGDSNPNPDIMYASLLRNQGLGFNSEVYDYQILLPDDGAEGPVSNTPYYFYIELLGATN